MGFFDDNVNGILIFIAVLLIYKWHSEQTKQQPRPCRKRNNPMTLQPRSISINHPQATAPIYQHPQATAPIYQQAAAAAMGPAPYQGPPLAAASLTETSAPIKTGPNVDQSNFDSARSYQDITEIMGLESSVINSHAQYIEGFTGSVGVGLPTGSSSNVELEETGRSYGTSDFVGLTSRKWCKARQLAKPADDSRVIPSFDEAEDCHITLTDMI